MNLPLLLEKVLGKVDLQAVDHFLDGFTELNLHYDVAQVMAARTARQFRQVFTKGLRGKLQSLDGG